jgi:hypothetical protein
MYRDIDDRLVLIPKVDGHIKEDQASELRKMMEEGR